MALPVTGVTVRVIGGTHHEVDSSESAFIFAGQQLVRGLMDKPELWQVLEPVGRVSITVPPTQDAAVREVLQARGIRLRRAGDSLAGKARASALLGLSTALSGTPMTMHFAGYEPLSDEEAADL